MAELETLRKLGWTGAVFVVDDNFIGNIKQVRQLLPELRAWQETHGHPFDFLPPRPFFASGRLTPWRASSSASIASTSAVV